MHVVRIGRRCRWRLVLELVLRGGHGMKPGGIDYVEGGVGGAVHVKAEVKVLHWKWKG